MQGLISQLHSAAANRSPTAAAQQTEREYEGWLRTHYPEYFVDKASSRPLPFAFYHDEFWSWVWALRAGQRPKPLVAVWPRGTGKSTGAELSVVAAAARRARRYGLYVSGTQDLADKHVETIGAHLESPRLAEAYPLLAERSLGKYGNSRGWRRNRLRTTAGFYIDAVGLDVAVRGIKVERDRPDFIVLDDVDEEADDEAAVDRKVTAITRSILPAGASDVAVLFVQNVIHYESVCARLCGLAPQPEGRRREQFLMDRSVSGPHPALLDFEWEYSPERERFVITKGAPTWPEGLDRRRCQQWINDIGITSFRAEFQHENVAAEGSPFAHINFAVVAPPQVPWDRIVRLVTWCDPATSDTDKSDSNGVVVAGVTDAHEMYVLFAWEKRSTPTETLKVALTASRQYGARTLGIETDQGGDTWQSVYYQAIAELIQSGDLSPADWVPAFAWAKAGASQMGKTARWQMMVPDYERSGRRRIYHVQGPHALVQRALLRVPAKKPYDLVDALWHAWNDLLNDTLVRFPLAQGVVRGAGWSTGSRGEAPPSFMDPRDPRRAQQTASGLYIPRV